MKKATISIVLWEPQIQILLNAAAKEGKSLSEFFREDILPIAAAISGQKMPEVPKIVPHRFTARNKSGSRAPLAPWMLADIVTAVADELQRRSTLPPAEENHTGRVDFSLRPPKS